MTSIVNGLEAEFSGEVTVFRLNAAEPENVSLMQNYGLRGHPSFAVLDKDGRVTQIFFGPQSEEELRTALKATLP